MDTEVKSIIIILVDKYFELFWRYISEVIISDGFNFFKLQYLIGSRIGSPGEEIGILFKGNHDKIMNWCKTNTPTAPKRIVRLTPIFYKTNGKVTWYSLSRSLIDEFGDVEGFMGDLDSNFSSFSWTGSLVPLIEMKLDLVTELIDHRLEPVKEWANYKIGRLKSELKYNRFEDEERLLH